MIQIVADTVPAEAAMLWSYVATDDVLCHRCITEVCEQEREKQIHEAMRREIADAFKQVCLPVFEDSFLRPLLASLDILDEYANEPPLVLSEEDGLAYITYPTLLFPMIGPATKLGALFDERSCFDKFRLGVLERYGSNMHVFHDKLVDTVNGLQDWPAEFGRICHLSDLLNELRGKPIPRKHSYPGFFENIFPSYLAVLHANNENTSYYLSTVELLALCKCAKVNVVIVRRFGHTIE